MSEQLPIVSPARIVEVVCSAEMTLNAKGRQPIERGGLVLPTSNSLSLANQDLSSQAQTSKEFRDGLEALRKEAAQPGILVAPDNQVASLLQTFIARRGDDEQKIVEGSDPMRKTREVQFDEHDWKGWAGSFFSWWKKIVPHPWLDTPSNKRIKNSARVGILGDWGTGLYGAPTCARSIEHDKKGYDVLLHLGDVYYSGDSEEIKERFLDLWPDPTKTSWENKDGVFHRACNSNHEMYTGGHGYFNFTLSKFEQSASYFALSNDHWILAGLDTGYAEGDLMGQQVEWLAKLVSQADGRRIILFSHHQPFSWFGNGYENVTGKLSAILRAKGVFAWYWGHEHRCILFDAHPEYGLYGRCVGHSGYPYFRDDFGDIKREPTINGKDQHLEWRLMPARDNCPSARILDGPNPYVGGYVDRFGPNGYMSLDFDREHLTELVHAADGTLLYDRPLS